MTLRIGIAGLTGRMGALLAEEVPAAGAVLAGGIGRPQSGHPGSGHPGSGHPGSGHPGSGHPGSGRPGSGHPVPAGAAPPADLAALAAASDVVIDFTHAAATQAHAAVLAAAGTAWVLGTSGLSAADEAAVAAAAQRIPVVYAANFSAGVNLVLALAERMAGALPAADYDAEIMEMHHRQKVDAPSGTAIGIGRAVARGRGVALEDVMESGRHGHTGPRKPGAIGFAALRGGQIVGEHTLIFAAATEQIVLVHRAFDRRSFAQGAVRAALWLAGRPPGLRSMMDVLGIG